MLKLGGQQVPGRTLALVGADAGLIAGSLLLAAVLRFHESHPIAAYLNTSISLMRFAVALVVCQLCLYYYDLYAPELIRSRSLLAVNLLSALGTACVILGVLYYMAPELSFGRGIAAIAAPTILLVVFGSRLLVQSMPSWKARERILILGTGEAGVTLVQEILSRPELNLEVVGFLDERGNNIGQPLVNPGIVGAVAEVESVVAKEKVDRVVISLAERRGQTPVEALLRLKFAGITVDDAHSLYEQVTGRILLQRLVPSGLILSGGFRKPAALVATKRVVDVLVSLTGLLLALPLMVLVALAIWLETGRPILFRQKRIGLMGAEFEMLKFRSMYHNGHQPPASWTAENDHRITRVGRVIRRSRLDELPQLINVLRGDMSLVGPRPEQPVLCEMLAKEIPYYIQRHSVRPGVTGWAQIKYRYGATVGETRNKLEHDLFYIKHMSFSLDMAILFETVKVVLSGRGAK